jgi:pyridoxamine 5'-phosphate oxidase
MADKTDISKLHLQYKKKSLTETSIDKDPFKQFAKWFDQALKGDLLLPNAMALATAAKDGKPSVRMVLLKEFDEKGFVFFTNYASKKGKELENNPYASVLFYWESLERQVRIDGTVEKITKEESEDYFKTRPFKSRVGAWASKQSSVIESRSVIIKEFLKYLVKFGKNVPLPPVWGGYRLLPTSFEFWQGRPNRLHDRISYTKQKSGWKIERLAP